MCGGSYRLASGSLGIAGIAKWALELEGDADAVTRTETLGLPATATEAITFITNWYDRWHTALAAKSDDELWSPLSTTAIRTNAPIMKLGQDDPLVNYVLHQHREMIHHGAEVALLRDLFAARAGKP